MEIEVELKKPFILYCPKLQQYWKAAVKYEVGVMKEALAGYKIMTGSVK